MKRDPFIISLVIAQLEKKAPASAEVLQKNKVNVKNQFLPKKKLMGW